MPQLLIDTIPAFTVTGLPALLIIVGFLLLLVLIGVAIGRSRRDRS